MKVRRSFSDEKTISVSTGSSNWTWQALLGVGYAFDWCEVNLSIRNLSYDFGKNDADLRMTGPTLGATFGVSPCS